MADYVVKALGVDTWDAFARLVERHNGVFGGCWCTWFHTFHAEKTFTAEGNHALKHRLVEEDRAHAALVFAGDEAVAWAQYGPPEELPNIHHRKEYEETLDTLPDYRITCIFVDKKYRRKGVTAIALRGAIDLIAQAGGGVVEGYHTTPPTTRRCPSSTTQHDPCTRRPGSPTSAPKARGIV
jgi:GNAT superfamily N-acetyltransferase